MNYLIIWVIANYYYIITIIIGKAIGTFYNYIIYCMLFYNKTVPLYFSLTW